MIQRILQKGFWVIDEPVHSKFQEVKTQAEVLRELSCLSRHMPLQWHEYYDSLYTVICESEDIMNNDNYTEKLNSMCHLTLTYNSQSSSAIT